ncbi:TPA_asm: M [Bouteloa betacytorhabdovirus 1]|nr:TPA_asm: M [Bouteloa betacytorhabdovirus 1]
MADYTYYGFAPAWEFTITAVRDSQYEVLPIEHLNGIWNKIFKNDAKDGSQTAEMRNMTAVLHALIYVNHNIYTAKKEYTDTVEFGHTERITFEFPSKLVVRCAGVKLPTNQKFSGIATTLILDQANHQIPLIKYESKFKSTHIREVTSEKANNFLEQNPIYQIPEWITPTYITKHRLQEIRVEDGRTTSTSAGEKSKNK